MEKPLIKISVRNLIEQVYLSGDINIQFQNPDRILEGIKGHKIIQDLKPEGFIREVPVSFTVEREKFIIELHGRIDGVLTNDKGVIIEEIKTVTIPLSEIERDYNQSHWAQAKIYSYIYGVKNQLEKIFINLLYYQVETGEVKNFEQVFMLEELEQFFSETINNYAYWIEKNIEWVEERNSSIKKLKFPYETYRQGQREMAIGVYKTILEGKKLFVQAPTGIGKTLATLFPAIKALGEGHGEKIFYLTARNTGRTVAEKALEKMREKGLKLKSVVITAKEKVCFNKETNCTPEFCPYAKGYYDRIKEAIEAIFNNEDSFSKELLEIYAQRYTVCPFEFSLDIALLADCIICDYNYVFDPRVYLRRFFMEKGKEYIFLIDEAHNLIDRGREMFSAYLQQKAIKELITKTELILPEINKILKKLDTFFDEVKTLCLKENKQFWVQYNPPDDLSPLFKDFLQIAQKWLASGVKTPFYEEILNLYYTIQSMLSTLEFYDDRFITYIEIFEEDIVVKLFCLDPSYLLADKLKSGKAAVFFSATLTPIDYFVQMLGGDETSYKFRFPSPFPGKNLCVLLDNKISTKYRHREKTYGHIAQAISTVIQEKKGNYLVFFPSYQYLNEVYQIFIQDNPDVRVISQESGMSEKSRTEFLQEFRDDINDTLVGFAVMGGIFGEGIDLVGERLLGAIIVGVGLPQVCLEREIIRTYFNERNGKGFEYAYIYPGMNKVLQAAGRVIRTEKDRGLILLIDKRFSNSPYRFLYPAEWKPVRIKDAEMLKIEVKKFWEKAKNMEQ